jgi:uncharacterized damage-inducible protein DinB
MLMIPMFLKEMNQEAGTSRKMLERVPAAKFEWRPHPKSMTLRQLATHVAELPSWVSMTLTTDELDFATSPYNPEVMTDTRQLVEYFEKLLTEAKTRLSNATETLLLQNWTLRNGDQILMTATKAEVIRMAYCQTVHHRAQLGVFLRLLDIPIPGSYGPSADEMEMAL